MKKEYSTPSLEVIKYKLADVLNASPTEDPFGEVIGGGGSGGGPFDDLGDGDL